VLSHPPPPQKSTISDLREYAIAAYFRKFLPHTSRLHMVRIFKKNFRVFLTCLNVVFAWWISVGSIAYRYVFIWERLCDDDACWSCDDDDLAVFSIEGDVKRQRAKDDRQHNNASQWTSDAWRLTMRRSYDLHWAINTLAAELLRANSTGPHCITFSTVHWFCVGLPWIWIFMTMIEMKWMKSAMI